MKNTDIIKQLLRQIEVKTPKDEALKLAVVSVVDSAKEVDVPHKEQCNCVASFKDQILSQFDSEKRRAYSTYEIKKLVEEAFDE